MKRTSRTQTSDDVGHHLSEIVDDLTRARRFAWPISLTVFDRQGEMMLQTPKADWAGITSVAFLRRLVQSPLRHSARLSLGSPIA